MINTINLHVIANDVPSSIVLRVLLVATILSVLLLKKHTHVHVMSKLFSKIIYIKFQSTVQSILQLDLNHSVSGRHFLCNKACTATYAQFIVYVLLVYAIHVHLVKSEYMYT